MEVFTTQMTAILASVKDGLSLFLEPPIVYFVAAAGVGVVIKLAKRIMPMKKG